VAEEGAYILIIDSQLPIASLVIQSKQMIDIMDVKDNLAKINRCSEPKDPGIQSLVYLTLEGDSNLNNNNRIEIKIRTSEG
jgi:hypothetical protein